MTIWQRLDPRLHLSAAVGWAVFIVVTVAALVAASLAASEAQARVSADRQRLLTQFAIQIRQALATNLATRRSILQATAAQISSTSDGSNTALRNHLEAVRAQFPELTWLGVADALGHVTAATASNAALATLREGDDVSSQVWYRQARQQAYLGLAHPGTPGQAARFIELAVPLTPSAGQPVGVLGACLDWGWVQRLQADLLRSVDASSRLDLLLASGDGTVLVGPDPWLGRALPDAAVLAEGGRYLVGQPALDGSADAGLGWRLVVRQDAVTALAPARSTQRLVFFSVLLAGLAAAAVAVWATRVLMRRLARLAAQAQAVRSGALQTLGIPPGQDEISRIGATLAQVVDHLQQEKGALQTLNAELDARVIERTARIERMADDARHAAVTRERLRMARDLHDTLAHSLMALLTQIRLVRKLRTRLPDEELEAELARAEDVAASGLTEARAAITQMRHNGVRETGLGPALQGLLARFQERTGVAAALEAEPDAAELASERAETAFRIAEEALHNVERHAQARHLTLQLSVTPPADSGPAQASAPLRLRLSIRDDGVGFDPSSPRPGHYGLRGIAEQAELMGADLEVHSQPDKGTQIVVAFDA
jgi:signal transduction histidine kinase